MASTTTVTPWALDRHGRSFGVGDKVEWEAPDNPGVWYVSTVIKFDPVLTNHSTGEVNDRGLSVFVIVNCQIGGHTRARWVRPPMCQVMHPDDGGPGFIEAMEDRPAAIMGDVVGVMESGPWGLAGRTGEVDRIAYHRVEDGQWDTGQVCALHVICDGNRAGWVDVADVTVLYPVPEPGFSDHDGGAVL